MLLVLVVLVVLVVLARIASSVPPDGLSLSLRMILDDNTVLKLIHFVSVFFGLFSAKAQSH